MIIKGASRRAPDQLAAHLLRTDTNGRVEILELQSPHATLPETFRDWQLLATNTKGTKGLYHANIDPAEQYKMSPEQWKRSVSVLEEELGLQGQPRAVVLHEKHGRQHIHVVWQRTDLDTMTLRSDSQNYQAHERASNILELEFGHERVPGKHAKRDRDSQPEFPKSQINHAEWQQGERSGLDPRERKAALTALYQQSDSGQTFKVALEEKGYILAQGDRRDFVIVDQAGDVHSLGRQLQGVKAAELRARMADVGREALPTVEEARTLQEQRQQDRQKEARQPEPQQTTPEPPNPSQEPPPAQQQQAQQEPSEPPLPTPEPTAAEVVERLLKLDDELRRQQQPEPPPSTPETAALREALAERQVREADEIRRRQTEEFGRLNKQLAAEYRHSQARLFAEQQAERDQWLRENDYTRTFFEALKVTVQRWFTPKAAAERDAAYNREYQALEQRQREELHESLHRLEKIKDLELQNTTARHEQELRDHATRSEQELDRYIREQEAARQLAAEREEQRRREQDRTRDGPDRPPPRAS
jgi:hypothetical protein